MKPGNHGSATPTSTWIPLPGTSLATGSITVARSTVPILLIHGTADTSIPVRHSRMLAAARPAGTTLREVPGTERCGALGVAPDEFARRVLTFFARADGR